MSTGVTCVFVTTGFVCICSRRSNTMPESEGISIIRPRQPNLMQRMITGFNSCVYRYDPRTKQQSLRRKSPLSPRPKRASQVRRATKSILEVFRNICKVVQREFLPKGQTDDIEYFHEVLWGINCKHPYLWYSDNKGLQHECIQRTHCLLATAH